MPPQNVVLGRRDPGGKCYVLLLLEYSSHVQLTIGKILLALLESGLLWNSLECLYVLGLISKKKPFIVNLLVLLVANFCF